MINNLLNYIAIGIMSISFIFCCLKDFYLTIYSLITIVVLSLSLSLFTTLFESFSLWLKDLKRKKKSYYFEDKTKRIKNGKSKNKSYQY